MKEKLERRAALRDEKVRQVRSTDFALFNILWLVGSSAVASENIRLYNSS